MLCGTVSYKHRMLAGNKVTPLISLIIIILPITPLRDWLFSSNNDPAIYMLAPCFSLGCLFALCKDYSVPSPIFPIVGVIAAFFIVDVMIKSYAICFSFCLLILFAFSNRASLKFNVKTDPSYGMYLWGFPLQQMIANYITNDIFLGCLLSLAAAFMAGTLSWKFIEKPFMKSKRAR